MANEERRWLTGGIRDVLLPALHKDGFEHVALSVQENKSELRTTYPFGRLRRTSASGLEVLEIIFAKYGKPAFCMSAGVVPLVGITHEVVGKVAASDVWSSHLPRHYVFYDIPLIQRWFSLWHWPGRQVTQADVLALVTHVVVCVIPEIDMALRNGKCGKHVKVMGG